MVELQTNEGRGRGALMSNQPTEEAVRKANRRVYNRKTCAEYDQNESIFCATQQKRIQRILLSVKDRTQGERFLDVGCGTGNVLKLARSIFPDAWGVDLADRLLADLRRNSDLNQLVSAQAHELPFADRSFDVLSMYALLHHMLDPKPALTEAYRTLRPGGILYADHDPNYYFGRFYKLFRRLQPWRGRPTFGTDDEDLAEYHHTHTAGLDPVRIRRDLEAIGFSRVTIKYRHGSNTRLRGLEGFAKQCMEKATRVFPLATLHTHFLILAEK